MNTQQINSFLCDLPQFAGTFAADALPAPNGGRHRRLPMLLVVNTDPRREPGTHWVAVMLKRDGTAECFDSLALSSLPESVERYLHEACTFLVRNTVALQHPLAVSCGLYCCVFLRQRAAGHTFKTFLRQFSTDTERNEDTVHELYHKFERRKNKSFI